MRGKPKLLTTAGAARAVGVTRPTLYNWMAAGLVGPSLVAERGALWTASDVAKLRKIVANRKALPQRFGGGWPLGKKRK